nr:ribonuclease H-like domain, reverse transcriptase, RNA-dependent DNA polymerase [Tanacetum cinerariifolium]
MLNPSNYSLWAIRMQIILEANCLWEMIEPNEKIQADNKKDKIAIAFFYQALPEEQLLQITKHKTAKAIWEALKTRHIGEERVQQARFSQGRNHENFKEERKDEETSHKNSNKNNFKKSSYDTSKLQCYKCKKIGHIAPNCPQRTKLNEKSNLVEEDIEPTLLMAILEDSIEEKHVKEVDEQKVSLHEEDVGYKETNMDSLWYLDNGASNHMTGVREHFKEFDEKFSGKVRLGDGSYIEIKGKGLILIECDDEKQRIISHRNRLYKANLRISTPVCLLASLKDDTWLWHARLGHLNFESLRSMAQKDLVHGIPAIKHTTQVCDVCLIKKHSRAPFPKKAKARSTSPLDLVYGDLCGPITPPTPSGKKYIFLLVDDYSRYMWVYFLSTKDQAFDTFKEYKKSIENEVPSQHLTKLDDRSSRMVYLGNEQGSKAYRLFDPTTQRICVSRDVKFKENETCDWKEYMTANNKWEVHHLDIKSAFLHRDLKEEVYVTQPKGFIKRQDNGKVYRLIKALYELRQAPRAWNIKLDNTLKSLDFKKCALEQAIYTKTSKDSTLLIGVYVEDLIIISTPKKEIDKFKDQMEEKFKMSDLGLLAYYLGIEVTQTDGDISIKQSAYANKILKEAKMLDCNETLIPMDPRTRLIKVTEGTMVNSTEYRSLIGCLRYLLHTRPDLCYSVGLLSRFMQEPREQHMKAIRQVLR